MKTGFYTSCMFFRGYNGLLSNPFCCRVLALYNTIFAPSILNIPKGFCATRNTR